MHSHLFASKMTKHSFRSRSEFTTTFAHRYHRTVVLLNAKLMYLQTNQRIYVQIMKPEDEGKMNWAREQEARWSAIAKNAVVRYRSLMTDSMKTVSRYGGALWFQCKKWFENATTEDLVHDPVSSHQSRRRRSWTYSWYVPQAKDLNKNWILPLLVEDVPSDELVRGI